MFDDHTYIILDVPSPIVEQVMGIRTENKDSFRMALPVEITVAGSSGVGVIRKDQDPEEAFALLNAIAKETSPIAVSFGEVICFPNTDLFVVQPVDQRPFHRLHERIAASGIKFDSNPFPYTPHCTLRGRSPVTEEEAQELLNKRIMGTVTLYTLQVLRVRRLPPDRRVQLDILHEVKLTGAK